MLAQPQQLVAQRIHRDALVLLPPFAPLLPSVTTAPSGHDQDSFPVGSLEERLVLEFAFEANGVQADFFHVAKFGFPFRLIDPQEHVRRPAAAAYKNWLAVDLQQAVAL